jgi:hypothetical protein
VKAGVSTFFFESADSWAGIHRKAKNHSPAHPTTTTTTIHLTASLLSTAEMEGSDCVEKRGREERNQQQQQKKGGVY